MGSLVIIFRSSLCMSNCAADRSSVTMPTCTDDTRRHITAGRMHVRSVSLYTAYATDSYWMLASSKSHFMSFQTPEGLPKLGGKGYAEVDCKIRWLEAWSSSGVSWWMKPILTLNTQPEWCDPPGWYWYVQSNCKTVRDGFPSFLQMSQMHKVLAKMPLGSRIFPMPW